jgi:hypothetical protein
MTARVFIHPRCVQGPAAGALAAHLQSQGYDVEKVVCGPSDARGRYELVRLLEDGPLGMRLERFDGTQYLHKKGQPAPQPEAA